MGGRAARCESAKERDMSEHIVKSFTEQLDALANSVAQMGGLAEAQFANAIEAIAKRDGKLAETAIGTDDRVDRIQQTIEELALKLLALRQPMAVDLRTTLAAIKIAYELERIGDLAKNIGKRALVLNREPPIRLTQSLARMGRQSLMQLKMVLDSYPDRDAAGAEASWRNEDEGPLLTFLRDRLEREGYRVLEAHDGGEALLIASEEQPDLELLALIQPQ